jgi:CelD/BcsL family acetyltransferase involved in cellulose biosynthesis
VNEVRAFRSFRRVERDWTALYDANPALGVYQSPSYAALIWRHLFPYRLILRVRPVFVCVYREGRPVMILPLLKKWFRARYWLYGHSTGCAYLDIPCEPGLDTGGFEAALRSALGALRKGSVLAFTRAREGSNVYAYAARREPGECTESFCSEIPLPDSFDAYLASLSRNVRQNLRTARNRAVRDGKAIEFEPSWGEGADGAEDRALLDLYVRRQSEKYRTKGGALYAAFVRRFEIGTLVMREWEGRRGKFVLRVDGQPAAFADALEERDGRSVLVTRLAIDPRFGQYSPGMLLVVEMIRFLMEKTERRVLDLTHGTEEYKRSLGARAVRCLDITIHA